MANPWDNDEIIRTGSGSPAASTPTTPAVVAPTDGPSIQQAAPQLAADRGEQSTLLGKR